MTLSRDNCYKALRATATEHGCPGGGFSLLHRVVVNAMFFPSSESRGGFLEPLARHTLPIQNNGAKVVVLRWVTLRDQRVPHKKIYLPKTTLAFESCLLVVYMLPPHSLPSNKPRLMLAIRGLSAAVRIDEKSAFVATTPKLRRLSLTRMPIAGIPEFLVVGAVEKHPLSTDASREAPVDKCARRHGGQAQEFP